MGSLPFVDFNLFREFPEDVCFGGFGPAQSALAPEGERRDLVSAAERPWKKGMMASEARTATALKSHSEAERRRREKINAHLSTLRSLVPGTEKLDKAALLSEVISYVRALKTNASEISKECSVPADADEVKVEVYGDGSNAGNLSVRASLCCEDRPELLADLKQTLQALRLKTAEAEISALGGRVKNVVVVTSDANTDGIKRHLFTDSIRRALESVLERVSSPSDFSPRSWVPCKRRRLSSFQPSSPR